MIYNNLLEGEQQQDPYVEHWSQKARYLLERAETAEANCLEWQKGFERIANENHELRERLRALHEADLQLALQLKVTREQLDAWVIEAARRST
jgi:hypothetical protein